MLKEFQLNERMIGYWDTDPDNINKFHVNNRMFFNTGLMLFGDIMP